MATLNVRVDDSLKKQASELFADLGLDMSTAVNMFLKQAVMYEGLPFEVRRVLNATTIAAMEEFDEMKKNPEAYKRYPSFKAAMAEVLENA